MKNIIVKKSILKGCPKFEFRLFSKKWQIIMSQNFDNPEEGFKKELAKFLQVEKDKF